MFNQELMSTIRIVVVRNIVLLMLVGTIITMSLMLYDLQRTKEQLATSFISKPLQTISIELDGFFHPINHLTYTAMEHGSTGQFSATDIASVNSYFAPMLRQHPQISSMGIANNHGMEHDLLKATDQWLTRTINMERIKDSCLWQRLDITTLVADSLWQKPLEKDPRVRPWHVGAMKDLGSVFWTGPYIFNTRYEPGMTAACTYKDPTLPDSLAILAFDLTLVDLSVFTDGIEVSENGKAMVLTPQLELVSIANAEQFQSADENTLTASLKQAPAGYYAQAIQVLEQQRGSGKEWDPFNFELEDRTWWAQFQQFDLDQHNHLIIGVVLPEQDMMSNVYRSQNIIYIGMGITFIFMLVMLWTHLQITRANRLLSDSNSIIKQQSVMMERKNHDLLDSIHYAKKLQHAILPADDRIQELLPKSFVVFRPKDGVSGDFYWVKKQPNGELILAVGDCTGHGVPGAFMSILGMSLLSTTVFTNPLAGPGQLLTMVRRLLINKLTSDQNDTKDGMDIGLCYFNPKTDILRFAGAFFNLYVVRTKTAEWNEKTIADAEQQGFVCETENSTHCLFTLRGDRQPIGIYHTSGTTRFTEHVIRLLPGDNIYLSSDGLSDQFGGPSGKKFGQQRFRQLLLDIQSKPVQQQHHEVTLAFEQWRDKEFQVDDICIMGVQLIPVA